MSFYGKVTYYLSEAFRTQQYDNAGKDNFNNHAGTYGGPYTLSPLGKNDILSIKTGNGWLNFGSSDNTNELFLGHRLINETPAIPEEDKTTLKAEKVSTASDATTLAFEDIITIPQITYDKAGHLTTDSTVMAFKLPNNPGQLELDDVKARLATLEELVTGNHGDSGGSSGGDEPGGGEEPGSGGGQEDPIPSVDNPFSRRLERLETHIQDWDMFGDDGTRDINQNLLEQKGIGTTLHDLLILLGLETSVQDNATGKLYYMDVAIPSAFPLYNQGVRQILPAVNTAYTSGATAQLAASQLNTCISRLLVILRDNELISTTDYDTLSGYLAGSN